MSVFPLFILITGYVIGLGAVTVIDLHGFLGRKSSYWTEATTRTHKVTKPLIWIGTTLVWVGIILMYAGNFDQTIPMIHTATMAVLTLNGIFLSFSVSPFLLQREQEGRSRELLPASWQQKITASFIVSVLGWWGSLLLFVTWFTNQ